MNNLALNLIVFFLLVSNDISSKTILIKIDDFKGNTETQIMKALELGMMRRKGCIKTQIQLQFSDKIYEIGLENFKILSLSNLVNVKFIGSGKSLIHINEVKFSANRNMDFLQARNFIYFENSNKIEFENLSFTGDNFGLKEATILDIIFINLSFHNCKEISFTKCNFSNFLFTIIKTNDCKNVNILSNDFSYVGQSTFYNNDNSYYAYDCFLSSGKSEFINILSNNFLCIGTEYPPMLSNEVAYRNDGDCLHFAAGTNILIKNNKFLNWAARAIKIQAGSNIKIQDNNAQFVPSKTKFPTALIGSFIDAAMVNDVSNVAITNNYTYRVHTFFTSDNALSKKYLLKDVTIEKNTIDSCYYGYRIEGTSLVEHVFVNSNHFNTYHQVFSNQRYEGSTKNVKFTYNTIKATAKDWPISLYYAQNVTISDNVFEMKLMGGAIRLHSIDNLPNYFNNIRLERNQMIYQGSALKRYNFLARDGSDNMYAYPKKVVIAKNTVRLKDNIIVNMEDSTK